MTNIHELAHEIRTPLAALRSNTDLLRDIVRQLQGPPELMNIVEECLRTNDVACKRLEELILAAGAERRKIKVHEVLDNALLLLAFRMKQGDGVRVTKDYGDVAPVESRGGQLHQVFM